MNKHILLISFYNPKSLGLRYIENALSESGHTVSVVFFKGFNSVNPKKATEEELRLLGDLIDEKKPMVIGLSVMASLYLETVEAVSRSIKERFSIPVVWGGVYPTMFPEECMEFADFVMRSEGEQSWLELADAVKTGDTDYAKIKNLVYRDGEKIIQNELRELLTDLDGYGMPHIGGANKYLIENGAVTQGDPQLGAFSYELSASRGCPYACSYCCSINLRRITAGKGRYVRFREVDNVIGELVEAKAKMKRLKVIHFWDEIFCDDADWIDRFVERYRAEIGLPFEIWGHPLKTDEAVIQKLRGAGLYKVVMGIQSGSTYIRKDIFSRPERQEDIIGASKVLKKCGVPQVIYDFMLRHPFETHDTLRETYALCLQLAPPFELQLHGLNFLPGTDIIQKALDMELVSPEDMRKFAYASLQEQYDMHWKNENSDEISNFWYKLIYLTQFRSYRQKSVELAKDPASEENHRLADKLYKRGQTASKFRYLYKKGIIVLKGTFH